MGKAFIVGVSRTLIAPKGGLHRDLPLEELAAPAIRHAWGWAKPLARKEPDLLILGNALAAGGNPARLCGLAVFSDGVPALTIDTQCCSGLDAIALAATQITAGRAQVVLAGGVESFSQAPLRQRKTKDGFKAFHQARFAPQGRPDPDVLIAAQAFAKKQKISRQEQEAYAIESHRKAQAAYTEQAAQIAQSSQSAQSAQTNVRANHSQIDPFTRSLSPEFCKRLPPLISGAADDYSITAATVAPQADAAAIALLVGEQHVKFFPWAIEVCEHTVVGCAPHEPALGASLAMGKLVSNLPTLKRRAISCVELMESFAAQAIADIRTLKSLGISKDIINCSGGMLARGHPIGASGAVLVGNLFIQLQGQPRGAAGLAAIPSAGGLGSALLLSKP